MKIIQVSDLDLKYMDEAAEMLKKAFPQSYNDCSEDEIYKYLSEERVFLAAFHNDRLIGFVGAIPQYGITAWELHPLVVDKEYRGKGIGTGLCIELEKILKEKGSLTIYLGSDDESESTTLSNTNLFENTFEKIIGVKNMKRHPYQFYEKLGYKIVGVIPDANGLGKPDIWMAKSLVYQ